MNPLVTGFSMVFSSFLLGWIAAPMCLMFSWDYALILYLLSWVLLILGVIVGGEVAYYHSINYIKERFGK